MATLVTVTCDRCGAIIPEVVANGVRLIGTISAHLDRSYDSLQRSEWQVCGSCYELVTERIGDVAGVPSEDWRRPPEPTEKDMAWKGLTVAYDGRHLTSSTDPITVAQRVLDGGEGPE